MARMRVVQVREPGAPLELVERGVPEPGPGQVRIRVEACGICHSDAGTVKLMLVTAKKRRSSSALRAHAAASAPVTSAQIAKLWARATRYWVAVT
jgi:NADPH:quinone reductase-like Zn-dependent oxidoreductase